MSESDNKPRTPLPFWRCRFYLRDNKDCEIVFQHEFGMIGKEGLPPTLQQVRRFVKHNLGLLQERNDPEVTIWQKWLDTLNNSIKRLWQRTRCPYRRYLRD